MSATRNSLTRAKTVDLMGRLPNPPETLECVSEQGGRATPPPRPTTSKGAKRSSNAPEPSDLQEKGQLSNPVQRRLSRGVVDELAHPYEEGASIDALARRYGIHRTTIIAHLDRQGVPRRRVARKMTDTLVALASERYAEGGSRSPLSHLSSVSTQERSPASSGGLGLASEHGEVGIAELPLNP